MRTESHILVCASACGTVADSLTAISKVDQEEWAPDASGNDAWMYQLFESFGSFGFQVSILVPQVLHDAARMHMVGERRHGD